MQLLKQNAAATVLVGPVLDSAGAAVTNAVIGDFQITKNGTSAAMAAPATRTHSHNGFYLLSLATGDTDTIGRLVISVNNTAQSMSTHRYTVLLPSVFDALITNATNSTGGLPAATNTITALAGAISTFAGGAVASVTNRVTANVDQWGGVAVTGMPLPTASYTSPPSAATNATAVRSELTVELARIDTTISSRLATASYTAPDNATIGTISTNLSTVNNNVLSRLAASAYVAPLSGSETAAAVWNASLSTYTTADTFGGRIVRSVNSNNTVQIAGGSYHIFSVLHDAEPNSIPEDAFVDNALSNRVLAANASAEVATAVRTELAIELGRIDVTSSSRLASSAYTAPDNAGITSIKTVTDRLNTGLVQDGAVWQFTVNMLENGPAGAGGGSATLGNQILILDQLDVIQNKTDLISGASGITSLLAGAVLDPGQITSFPETLTIGDSYTSSNGRAIQIPVVDTNGTPISSTGSLYFSSATVTFAIKRAGETDSTRIISGTATFVDPPGTGTGDEAPYALIELSSSETAKGLMKYKYTGILTFTWPGTSDEVMSFETNTITFKE